MQNRINLNSNEYISKVNKNLNSYQKISNSEFENIQNNSLSYLTKTLIGVGLVFGGILAFLVFF